MTKRLLAAAAVAGAVALLWSPHRGEGSAPSVRAHRAEPTRSVWDSVYTDSQATRGDSLYKQNCVKCHGPELKGGDDGSPLVGSDFLANWTDKTVGDVHDRIRTSMPPDNPKSIPRAQVTDIVAYLLAQNHFPSGQKVLTDDAAALNDIKIAPTKP